MLRIQRFAVYGVQLLINFFLKPSVLLENGRWKLIYIIQTFLIYTVRRKSKSAGRYLSGHV